MSLFKKHKTVLFFVFGISIIYILTRLYNILELPIFTDEAIYVRWAQIANNDANWRFISLTDGKQPSFVWAAMIFMRFVEDPLLAGRLVSLLAGLFSVAGLFFLGRELFRNKWVGILSSIVYVLFPMALVYDRMALYESMVGAFAVWGLYLTVLLVRKNQLDIALILGLVIGGGVLTKTSGFFSIYLLPLALILFDWREKIWKGVLRLIVLCMLSWGVYSVFLYIVFGSILTENITNSINLVYLILTDGPLINRILSYVFLFILPFVFLLSDIERLKPFLKWLGLAIISVVLAYTIFSILRLSPFFHIIEEKNALFVYPLKEWIEHPFRFWYGNLLGEWDWLRRYMTVSGILLVVLSFIIDRKFFREKAFLFIWFLVPFVALAIFGRTLYPRFIFFMVLPLLPLVGFSLFRLKELVKNKIILSLLFASLLFFPITSDYFILKDISKAPIPRGDLDQYINDWTSGAGVREIVEFLEKEAKDKKIFVGTQGTFGLMPYALEIYLIENKNITIVGFWPIEEILPKRLDQARGKMATYVVFYQPCHVCRAIGEPPVSWPTTLVSSYRRGIGSRHLSLYRINP